MNNNEKYNYKFAIGETSECLIIEKSKAIQGSTIFVITNEFGDYVRDANNQVLFALSFPEAEELLRELALQEFTKLKMETLTQLKDIVNILDELSENKEWSKLYKAEEVTAIIEDISFDEI